MKSLILATRNPGKVREIQSLLDGLPLRISSLPEYPDIPVVVEDGTTLEANAAKKAHQIFMATGVPALSDDTGLEVYSLAMEPGVHSARYAGTHVTYDQNNLKLLAALAGKSDRRARFRCVAMLIGPQMEHQTEGICEGEIATASRGRGGFGYDPIFVPAGYSQTFAELPESIKNKISHRAKAFGLMREYIATICE